MFIPQFGGYNRPYLAAGLGYPYYGGYGYPYLGGYGGYGGYGGFGGYSGCGGYGYPYYI
jgi:hypothetical protein